MKARVTRRSYGAGRIYGVLEGARGGSIRWRCRLYKVDDGWVTDIDLNDDDAGGRLAEIDGSPIHTELVEAIAAALDEELAAGGHTTALLHMDPVP